MIRGASEDGVQAFRVIPYARAARFAPPEPVPPRGEIDATRWGPRCPRPAQRLAFVRGGDPEALEARRPVRSSRSSRPTLPLLLGDAAPWTGAPMLGDTPWAQAEARGKSLRIAWAPFARHGTSPRGDGTIAMLDRGPEPETSSAT